MATQGPKNPNIVETDNAFGTVDWTNPNNAKVSDNNRAAVTFADSSDSYYLKATDFGFTIPTGSTIDGIKVEVEGHYEKSGTINFGNRRRQRIIKGGVIGSTAPSVENGIPITTDAYKIQGSATELWGLSWTAEDINDSGFGFAGSYGISKSSGTGTQTTLVDHIRITVYYTEGESSISSSSSSFSSSSSCFSSSSFSSSCSSSCSSSSFSSSCSSSFSSSSFSSSCYSSSSCSSSFSSSCSSSSRVPVVGCIDTDLAEILFAGTISSSSSSSSFSSNSSSSFSSSCSSCSSCFSSSSFSSCSSSSASGAKRIIDVIINRGIVVFNR